MKKVYFGTKRILHGCQSLVNQRADRKPKKDDHLGGEDLQDRDMHLIAIEIHTTCCHKATYDICKKTP